MSCQLVFYANNHTQVTTKNKIVNGELETFVDARAIRSETLCIRDDAGTPIDFSIKQFGDTYPLIKNGAKITVDTTDNHRVEATFVSFIETQHVVIIQIGKEISLISMKQIREIRCPNESLNAIPSKITILSPNKSCNLSFLSERITNKFRYTFTFQSVECMLDWYSVITNDTISEYSNCGLSYTSYKIPVPEKQRVREVYAEEVAPRSLSASMPIQEDKTPEFGVLVTLKQSYPMIKPGVNKVLLDSKVTSGEILYYYIENNNYYAGSYDKPETKEVSGLFKWAVDKTFGNLGMAPGIVTVSRRDKDTGAEFTLANFNIDKTLKNGDELFNKIPCVTSVAVTQTKKNRPAATQSDSNRMRNVGYAISVEMNNQTDTIQKMLYRKRLDKDTAERLVGYDAKDNGCIYQVRTPDDVKPFSKFHDEDYPLSRLVELEVTLKPKAKFIFDYKIDCSIPV